MASTAVPSISSLYEKSVQASRNAWRNNGEAVPVKAAKDVVRVDRATTASVPDREERFDAVAATCRAKLDAARDRYLADAKVAWRNDGDTLLTFKEVCR